MDRLVNARFHQYLDEHVLSLAVSNAEVERPDLDIQVAALTLPTENEQKK